jgi:hypothetical protein
MFFTAKSHSHDPPYSDGSVTRNREVEKAKIPTA